MSNLSSEFFAFKPIFVKPFFEQHIQKRLNTFVISIPDQTEDLGVSFQLTPMFKYFCMWSHLWDSFWSHSMVYISVNIIQELFIVGCRGVVQLEDLVNGSPGSDTLRLRLIKLFYTLCSEFMVSSYGLHLYYTETQSTQISHHLVTCLSLFIWELNISLLWIRRVNRQSILSLQKCLICVHQKVLLQNIVT